MREQPAKKVVVKILFPPKLSQSKDEMSLYDISNLLNALFVSTKSVRTYPTHIPGISFPPGEPRAARTQHAPA